MIKTTSGVLRFARFGYTAKGVVYVIVGWLAIELALGTGGSTTGKRGAIYEIASQRYGMILLGFMAFGLFCYACWRLLSGIMDLEAEGSDKKAIIKRIGHVISGSFYGSLGLLAVNIIIGARLSGSGSGSTQTLTARLMAEPYGRWLAGIVGAIVIAVGIEQFHRAYRCTFLKSLRLHEMSITERTWAERLGRLGYAARGVVYALIGSFLIQAAWQHDSSEVGGLNKALGTLSRQPYGPWLLGTVALGLVCYGIFSFVQAWYRSLPGRV